MPRVPVPEPSGLPVVVTRSQARAAGITERRIRRLVVTGEWIRVDRGTYLRAPGGSSPWPTQHDRARAHHRLAAEAAALRQSHAVIALGSAAIVHGLPLVSGTPSEPHLLVPIGAWSGRRAGVIFHAASDLAGTAIEVRSATGVPVPVTTVERTWVDIARTGILADALSAGDAALRTGSMTVESAGHVLDRLGSARGCRRARVALGLLSALRESPLESGSAARFVEWGMPLPRLQHTWGDADGFIARSDVDWPELAVIGFADGAEKYAIDPSRYRVERVQESRLRPFGTVVRWGWPDIAGTGLGLFRLLAPLLRHERPFPVSPVIW